MALGFGVKESENSVQGSSGLRESNIPPSRIWARRAAKAFSLEQCRLEEV